MTPSSFSIITFNAALLRATLGPWVVLEPVRHAKERLRCLCHKLHDVHSDVVVLQEVFGSRAQHEIAEHAQHSYPYVCYDDRRSLLGSGLMILSRYPTSGTQQLAFRSSSVLTRPLVAFGAMRTTVEVPGHDPITVVNTHLTAGVLHRPESPIVNLRRARQIDELTGMVSRSPGFEGLRILAGDFNAGPDVSGANYEQIVRDGFVDAFVSAANRQGDLTVTWTPENPLAAKGPHANSPPQRVDHVFFLVDGQKASVDLAQIIFVDDRVLVSSGENVPLSDHYGLRVRFSIVSSGQPPQERVS